LLRQDMEQRFGHDFSRVRVHTDEISTRDIDARAYTSRNHIVFGPSQYSPATADGRRLLAHELTHVVQQASAGRSGLTFSIQRDKKGAKAKPTSLKPKSRDEFSVEPDSRRRGVYMIRFERFHEREEALKVLFLNAQLPPGYTLEEIGVQVQGWAWKLTVANGSMGSIEVGAYQNMTEAFQRNLHTNTLHLTEEETAARRESEENFLNSRPIYLGGQTVREAFETCKDNKQKKRAEGCWGKRAGYFYYLGWQRGERSRQLQVKSSPQHPQIIKDWEWWLNEGYSLADTAQKEEELQTNILRMVVMGFASALSAAPGAVRRPSLPPTPTRQLGRVATTAGETYAAIKTALGGELTERDIYLIGAAALFEGATNLFSKKMLLKPAPNAPPTVDPKPSAPATPASVAGSQDQVYWQNTAPDTANKAANLKPGKADVTDMNRFGRNQKATEKIGQMQQTATAANQNEVVDAQARVAVGQKTTPARGDDARPAASTGDKKPINAPAVGKVPTSQQTGAAPGKRKGPFDLKARDRAATHLATANRDIADHQASINKENRTQVQARQELKKLLDQPVAMPANLNREMWAIEKIKSLEAKIEAIENLMLKKTALSTDEQAYLGWRKKTWKLQQEADDAAETALFLERKKADAEGEKAKATGLR
jgi:hypothetical protein